MSVERLERQVRTLRRVFYGQFVVVVVLLGLLATRDHVGARNQTIIADKIQARSIRIVDHRGSPRITIMTSSSGRQSDIAFWDSSSDKKLLVGYREGSGAVVSMGTKIKTRNAAPLSLTVDEENYPVFTMDSPLRPMSMFHRINPKTGKPEIGFANENGKTTKRITE